MPASHQQQQLSQYPSELAERRAQCAAAIENLDPDERLGLQRLLDALDEHIEAATLRMLELDELD